MSQKRKRTENSSEKTEHLTTIFRSSTIEDRSSTFIALFSPTLKPKELQNLAEINDASHKILAFRRVSNQQAITGGMKYVTGHDDDGEKYAGKRVEKVLEDLKVEGSCVVARWYGGVLLGPVRFTHIEACAREAIEKWRREEGEDRAKKQKVQDDMEVRPGLVRLLGRRDESISVLRELAAEKEDEVKNAKLDGVQTEAVKAARDEHKSSTGAKPTSIEYDQMSVEKLKMLEKARDATLSFLLKRIDKAEAELASINPPSALEQEDVETEAEPP